MKVVNGLRGIYSLFHKSFFDILLSFVPRFHNTSKAQNTFITIHKDNNESYQNKQETFFIWVSVI